MTIYPMRSLASAFATFVRSGWNMVHDSCDLEDYVQSFEGFFDRKDAEGDCLVMQGIENSDILAKVDLLSPDLFLLKLFQFSPAYDHVSRLSLQSLRLHPAIIGNP